MSPEPGKAAPLLRMADIEKSFPGVRALAGASLDLRQGEVHALVGENGAGKSTLIKILTGVQEQDSGTIEIDGRSVHFNSPIDAQRAGLATIYQEFTLIPALTIRDNLFLGREKTRRGFIDKRSELVRSEEILSKLGLEISPETTIARLTVAQQQLVEIGRALVTDARLLVMDEPTAALTPGEVESLFKILRELTADGLAVIFISHRLDEVFTIANRITVLRDGQTVDTRPVEKYDRNQLIEQMVGRSIANEYPRSTQTEQSGGLEIKNLAGTNVHNVTFSTKRGEILGFAGLMGAGRTDIARLIFGADARSRGEIRLDGKPLHITSPREAIANGICLLTEDRKSQGLVLIASALENFAIPNLNRWSKLSFVDFSEERSRFLHHVENLRIKIASPDQRAESLSGGNQQKLLVARWLETNSQVVIFDEPTRGIDVGAKYEMYLLIGELAAAGKVVIVISSELPELLGICHRILVMRRGQIAGEIKDVTHSRQEDIMAMAV